MRYGPLSAGGCPSEMLDETHCFRVMCPHPCCWEAEQRVARGVTRYRQSRAPFRSRGLLQEECPTLKIVNVSEWMTTRKSPKKNMRFRKIHSESCCSVTYQSQLCSQSLDFLRESNLSLAQIGPLDRSSGALCGSASMVVWIPNPNRLSHGPSHHGWKSPNITVRELACVPSSHLYDIPKPKTKKSRNVKKTEHLQLTSAQLASTNGRPHATGHMVPQPKLRASDTDLTEPRGTSTVTAEADLAIRGNQGVRQLEPAPEPPPGPHVSQPSMEPSPCLRNKPAAVHRERGRGPRREPAPRALTQIPQYRLDSDSANLAEGIDWLKLQSQTYLWKKHILQQNCHKNKTPVAPPQRPHHWAGAHHLSKSTLHHHHRGTLEIGPTACRCVECLEVMWGCGGGSHCGSSAAGGFPTPAQRSDLMHRSSLRQPIDTDNLGDRKLNGVNKTGPLSSAPELVGIVAPTQNSLECRVTVGQERGAGGWGSGRSLRQGMEDRCSGSDSDWEDDDFGPSESQLSAPPPSLMSDLFD